VACQTVPANAALLCQLLLKYLQNYSLVFY
jgi:hypothetical protein